MLRNRKHQESNKLKGVDLVDDETDLELGSFTSLQNWIPAEIYSIKKKRGVEALNPGSLSSIITEASDLITTEAGDILITEV